MTVSTEKLQQELQAAQRALAEARARCERHDAERQVATKELEENRSALLFMLEDLEAGRKKVEQAHQEWMAALDVVNDPIFLHDKQFRILRCNRAYQQCAGIPFHEIIGRPYYEIFPKAATPLPCCLRAMEKTEEEVTVGEAIYRSRTYSIHDEQGAYLYSIRILEDITKNKRMEAALSASEARLTLTITSAELATWDWNIKTGHDIFNEHWAEIRGYRFEEVEPHVSSWKKGVHPDDLAAMGTMLEDHFKGRTPFFQAEYRVQTKSGSWIWILDRGMVIERDADGNPLHMVGVEMDITERKQAEARLSEQIEELRRWHEATLGREIRIFELKREVNELLGQVGQPPRYSSAADNQQGK